MRSTETVKTKRVLSAIVIGDSGRRAAGRAREIPVETIKRTKIARDPLPRIEPPPFSRSVVEAPPPVARAAPLHPVTIAAPPPPVEVMPAPPPVEQVAPKIVAAAPPPVAPPKAAKPAKQAAATPKPRRARPAPVVPQPTAVPGGRRRQQRHPQLREVGLRIDERRKALNISMQRLGRMLTEPRTKGAIAHWIYGISPMTIDQANDVARCLSCDVKWLAFGIEERNTVPLSGEVRRGGFVTKPHDPSERVMLPPGFGPEMRVAAYRVVGDDLAPLRVGDLVYTAQRAILSLQDAVGHDAIVQLPNGRRVLREVRASAKDGCISLSDSAGRTMLDVAPINLWLVVAMVRVKAVEAHQQQLEREAAPATG
jgi:transcriptional regulator with XRE-family HTH domain